jgi:hypothetical protein
MDASEQPPEPPVLEPGSGPLVGTTLGVGLVAAAVALALFVWLGYQVRYGEPPAFDLAVRATVRSWATADLTRVMWVASVFGNWKLVLLGGTGEPIRLSRRLKTVNSRSTRSCFRRTTRE